MFETVTNALRSFRIGKAVSSATSTMLPLGSAYSDSFRKDRAPTARELIQQLVGVGYSCANLNAEGVAATKLRLMRRTSKGQRKTGWKCRPLTTKLLKRLESYKDGSNFAAGADELEEITDPENPIIKLLSGDVDGEDGQPNLSGHDLIWATQIYLETVGRAYWWSRGGSMGVPEQLLVLPSHRIREVPDYENGGIAYYELTGGTTPLQIDPREVDRFANPDPANPYFGGYAPMQAAIEKIRIYRKGDAHTNALLENMGRPDAVWSPTGTTEYGPIGDVEAKRMRNAFRQMFNAAGRGGVMVAEVPGSLEPIGWKPGDIVEVERAKQVKNDIANVFGVPDALLERNAANLASAKTADYAHAKYALNPRCSRMQSTLKKFLHRFDKTGRYLLVFDNPIPDDEVFILEQMKAGSATGSVLRNEVRHAIGLDAQPWGDSPLVPSTMVAVDPTTGKPDKPAPPPVTVVPPGKPQPKAWEQKMRQAMAQGGYSEAEIEAAVGGL